MTLRVYNTLGGEKQPFEPIEPGKVRMYVCGPTVYDYCHMGHARSVVVFDVIARYLRQRGFEVTYVRNFTDVDDKIIRRANETGQDPGVVAARFIDAFYADMDALLVARADHEPRVTEYIQPIIEFVQRLVARGHAYALDGDVYFDVTTFENYGKLSGRRVEDMEAGARVEVDQRKRHPHDFALWKAAKPGEPSWDSPWGKGRPGWHIECSAMSSTLLGETFDIHGGGKDLIFPHHENEIAQSEAASGHPYVKYWLHNGFVNINHEKMSKSLNNFLMIRDVLKVHHPEAVRMFLLSSHYRSPIDFTPEAMAEASARLTRIYTLLRRLAGRVPAPAAEVEDNPFWRRFTEEMDDDFNTAAAIGTLFEAVRATNQLLDAGDGADEEIAANHGAILRIGGVLGIATLDAEAYFKSQARDVDAARVEDLIARRTAARKARDWAEADRLRDELGAMGVAIEDRPEGTIWRVAD
ncbi:MAG: cysteine--tRNA ligase [Desulfobacteraceae bacterium]|nr:cysteine--tRNA ligase [Desulfobacteraceae bacterium]